MRAISSRRSISFSWIVTQRWGDVFRPTFRTGVPLDRRAPYWRMALTWFWAFLWRCGSTLWRRAPWGFL